MTKVGDYNKHSSNNIMPRLLSVDETGIETNPICSESRLSAPLNMPTSERKGLQLLILKLKSGGRKAVQRYSSGSRSSQSCIEYTDVWWHLVTSQLQSLFSPYPPPPFLSLQCLSNPFPFPLITDMIAAVVAMARVKRSDSYELWFLCIVTDRKKNVDLQLEMNECTLDGRFSSCPDDSLTWFD